MQSTRPGFYFNFLPGIEPREAHSKEASRALVDLPMTSVPALGDDRRPLSSAASAGTTDGGQQCLIMEGRS